MGGHIEGNRIGTTADEVEALGNGEVGIDVNQLARKLTIGGTAPDAGNLISGNTYGIHVAGEEALGVRIQGNKIGTNMHGTLAIATRPACSSKTPAAC